LSGLLLRELLLDFVDPPVGRLPPVSFNGLELFCLREGDEGLVPRILPDLNESTSSGTEREVRAA